MRFDNIETITANSYQNFHCKGLDYICLARSEAVTVKAYFFEGDVAKIPEAVVPHDHRYDFLTWVLRGSVTNTVFGEVAPDKTSIASPYQLFEYNTPLNGGDGFTWKRETALYVADRHVYEADDKYWCDALDVHTISITDPSTILLLIQQADKYEIGVPTKAYRKGSCKEVPSLDGLYDKPTVDYVNFRLSQLKGLI